MTKSRLCQANTSADSVPTQGDLTNRYQVLMRGDFKALKWKDFYISFAVVTTRESTVTTAPSIEHLLLAQQMR
jgi:hypothetical protein